MSRGEKIYSGSETRFNHVIMPDRELEHTEFYADFYKPNNMHHTCGMTLPLDSFSAAFTCQRPYAAGQFGQHADVVCQTLVPHLKRALTLHCQISILQVSTLGLEDALDAYDHAVLGLDQDLRIILCNRAAEQLLQSGDGLGAIHGRLTCTRSSDRAALHRLLSDAANPQSTTLNRSSLSIPRREPRSPLLVSVSPFRSTVPGCSAPLAALVFLSDSSMPIRSRASTLRALYSLTPTEIRVADLLLQGHEVREIAHHLGTSLETARFHVKRILAKTGSRRQSELIRRMMALPALE